MNDWELLIKTSIIIKLHSLNKWQSLNATWPETTKTVVITKVKNHNMYSTHHSQRTFTYLLVILITAGVGG